MPVESPPVDRRPILVPGDEILVPVLLHQRRDAVEREIPGDLLERACAGGAIFGDLEAVRRMHDVEQRRPLRAERAAVDRMVRVALDMDDVRDRVLGPVAEPVDQDAAGDRAIGAGVARLGGGGELERPHRRGERLACAAEAQSSQARGGKAGPGDLDEASTAKLHGSSSPIFWRAGFSGDRAHLQSNIQKVDGLGKGTQPVGGAPAPWPTPERSATSAFAALPSPSCRD